MSHFTEQKEKGYHDILSHLRSKGIRITQTRQAILRYMMTTKDHPSAERIYQDLRPHYPNISLATVYNNLKVLIDGGFVEELKISNDQTTYFDFMGHQHLNIVCERCGKIADFEDGDIPDLQREAKEQTGYEVTKTQILIYGVCPDCKAKENQA